MDATSISPLPATQTVNAHTVIHEANVKCLTNGIQTQEQLDQLVAQFNAIGAAQADTLNPELSIRNPPVPQQKGRPRTARLTSAIDHGVVVAGANGHILELLHYNLNQAPWKATRSVTNSPPRLYRRENRCGLCGEAGHDRRHCYDVHRERQELKECQRREGRRAVRDGQLVDVRSGCIRSVVIPYTFQRVNRSRT
ncbi:hypothetical protein K439DRAFT_1656960 [Ramaria rubella]|nr:hypothetical protein K439DRAFT_1656960 [Ramaria rubella]